jgi:hypothetical protein
MSSVNYSEAIKSKKGVFTSDREACGNIIGERDDSIIVEKGVLHDHVYVIPKSKIESFDGAQIILNTSVSELKSFEEKRGADAGSVKDTITDKVAPEHIKDTISGTVDKVKGMVKGDDDKK